MLVAKLGEWALVGLHFPSSYTNIIAILVAKLGEWAPVGLPFPSSDTNIIAILVAKLWRVGSSNASLFLPPTLTS